LLDSIKNNFEFSEESSEGYYIILCALDVGVRFGARSRGITFVKFYKAKIRHKILCHKRKLFQDNEQFTILKSKKRKQQYCNTKTANITVRKKYRMSSFIMPCRHAQSLPFQLTYVHQGRKLSYKFIKMNMYQNNECQRKLPDE
jgi:hypothetical protein